MLAQNLHESMHTARPKNQCFPTGAYTYSARCKVGPPRSSKTPHFRTSQWTYLTPTQNLLIPKPQNTPFCSPSISTLDIPSQTTSNTPPKQGPSTQRRPPRDAQHPCDGHFLAEPTPPRSSRPRRARKSRAGCLPRLLEAKQLGFRTARRREAAGQNW